MTPRDVRLEGGVPAALLPVRIETRFADDARTLRIRIYPDAFHIHTHEEALTPDELAAGRLYWRERFAAPADDAAARQAWDELARVFGPRRALWIAHATTPINVAGLGDSVAPQFDATEQRDRAWTRAAYAALMPDHWVAIGIRDGAEVFRREGEPLAEAVIVGPDPGEADSPSPGDALPLDDAMRWIVDYEDAVRRGMGITVADADVAAGLDRLIVLGVKGGLTADEGGQALADLLRAHVYTDGLDALRPGSPTNNTEAARTDDPDPLEALTRALDPALARTPGPTSGARRLERALGLEADAAHLGRMPGAHLDEQLTASLLIDVLWPATLGHYLDVLLDPLVDDATNAQVRAFAHASLQPGGPLPVLRVGKQPCGVLPVLAPDRVTATGGIEDGVHALLQKLRPFWRAAAARVPRLGVDDDPDTELLQLLQMTPLSAVARFRRLIGPELEPNTNGLEKHALAQQYYATLLTRLALGFDRAPRIAAFTADPRTHPLRVPWTQAGAPAEDAPLEPNVLWQIAQTARAEDGRATLDERSNAGSLLEALVAQAALMEIDAAVARVVHQHQVRIGALDRTARFGLRAPEVVRLEGPTPPPPNPGVPGPVAVATPRELAQLILPATTGTDTVAVWITKTLRTSGANPPAVLRDLASFLERLDALATRPAAQIDRALRGVLDAFSHRLDAWYTALATARLESLRARRAGVHVGGYGWVEDLRPDATPDSLGYVHAPSLEQAAASALLRSGHLAHRDSEHQTMNVDLRSDRVRLALGLLEGVAQGQPLAALLGYRLERALRDRDPRLARFIARLRQLAPMRPVEGGSGNGPSESIAARDVVDGVALLERWRSGEAALLDALNVQATERLAVAEELRRLDAALDAVSDVLVAESVFQMTAGNPERARSALAVLDRQERPIEPQFVRTQRTGSSYAQRLLVLLAEDEPPGPWKPLNDARSAAEPRLNAWCARLLGNPDRFRFTGRIITDGASPRTVQVPLRQLGLSPISLLMASRRGGPDAPSELEERIAQRVAAAIRPHDANPRVEIGADGPAGSIGLAALSVLLEWIGRVAAQRPVTAHDLAVPGGAPDDGLDVQELAARADAAVATFDAAVASLDDALSASRPSERTLRSALDGASAAGAQHAVARAIVRTDGGVADPATVLATLLELGAAVRERMRATRASLNALEEAGADTGSLDERALTDHHVARIRTIFGSDFPVLPRVSAANAEELSTSAAEQAALCGGNRLAPAEWLQRMAPVRPDADALQKVLTAVELLGGAVSPDELRVAQLPHAHGQRWAALPRVPDAAFTAELALAFHAPGAIDFTEPLAGLVCDDWTETIPSAEEVTGLSFHFDAPGARAPNMVLLAVPADARAETWSFDELVDVVREAADLAHIRMVGPRQLDALGTLLPTTCLPDNFRRDVPSVDMGKLTAIVAGGTAILGKTR